MQPRILISICLLCSLLCSSLVCEAKSVPMREWKFNDRSSFTASLTEVVGGLVFLQGAKGARMVHVVHLSDADLEVVAEHLDSLPAVRPNWEHSTEALPKALRGNLRVLESNKLEKHSFAGKPVPDLFLIYYSAHWCGPCRRFTPELVTAYKELIRLYPGRLELVFVSWDETGGDQLRYVREVGMPWTVLHFGQRKMIEMINRWAGSGIPCLALATPGGNLLFHSYKGEEYLGPQSVLDQTRRLMAGLYASGTEGKALEHRYRVVLHRRAAKGGDRPCQPYITQFDASQFQTLRTKRLTVRILVGVDGLVKSSEVLDQLDVVLRVDLEKVAESWLFLPRIQGGSAVEATLDIPVVLQ